jgi:small subunit ribosomal protein S13
MPRIAGFEIPANKRVEIGLTYIYGIGRSLSNEILKKAGIDPNRRVNKLSEGEINAIQNIVQNEYRIGGELRKEVQDNVKRLIMIGSYRGSRHRRNLPARGQRTRTNARTKRGKRKTVGSSKRETTPLQATEGEK